MVPEFAKGQTFNLSSLKPVDEYREAKALGYPLTHPERRIWRLERSCVADSPIAHPSAHRPAGPYRLWAGPLSWLVCQALPEDSGTLE
jgi:hypothetical protein